MGEYFCFESTLKKNSQIQLLLRPLRFSSVKVSDLHGAVGAPVVYTYLLKLPLDVKSVNRPDSKTTGFNRLLGKLDGIVIYTNYESLLLL